MLIEAPPPPPSAPPPAPEILESDVLEEVPSHPPAEPSLDFLSNLDELAAQEAKAAAVAEANDDRLRCPNCLQAMNRGDILCVNCGYDVRRGKVHDTKTEVAKPAGKGVLGYFRKDPGKKDALAPQGSFALGLLASFGFALVAAIPWILVVYLTDRDFYYLELLVGVAAGFGMQVGQKGYSSLGGWAAAGMTFIVLVVARVGVVIAVLIPLAVKQVRAAAVVQKATAAAATQKAAQRDPRIAYMMAREDLAKRGIDLDSDDLDAKTLAQVEDAQKRADDRLKKMSDKDYKAMLPKLEDDEIRARFISHQMDSELRSMGLNPDFQRIEPHNYKIARENIKKRVDAMTPAQRKAELKKLDDRALAELQEMMAHSTAVPLASELEGKSDKNTTADSDSANDSSSSKHGTGFVFGFLLVFAIIPLIFMLLSMAAAYRTAAGSVSG
jgi:hypothetical protein